MLAVVIASGAWTLKLKDLVAVCGTWFSLVGTVGNQTADNYWAPATSLTITKLAHPMLFERQMMRLNFERFIDASPIGPLNLWTHAMNNEAFIV